MTLFHPFFIFIAPPPSKALSIKKIKRGNPLLFFLLFYPLEHVECNFLLTLCAKPQQQKFEFTPEGIAQRAVATVDFYKGVNPRSPINRAFQQLI